jgi:hypothetical protein
MADYRTLTDQVPGIRNNNPGDLVYDGTQWQGMSNPNNDGKFIIFADSTWGLRALALDLTNAIKGGADTITTLITKYSPSSDNNNTAELIANMAANTGIAADTQLGTDSDTLDSLMTGIIIQEIGQPLQQQYYPDADIQTGISMAGSPVSTLLPAAVVAAQANPGVSIAIGVVLVMLFIGIVGTGKKKT